MSQPDTLPAPPAAHTFAQLDLLRAMKQRMARPDGRNVAPFADQIVTAPLDTGVATELSNYVHANGAWTGSDAQLQTKASGLVHLSASLPEYQLI